MDWFAKQLLEWHVEHGRKDLPWQQDINAYRVWVSEIMLQQTQVATVIDYFHRFMDRFPTLNDLASAPLDDVLHLWTGLGYYARARNLHKAAQQIAAHHGGEFPRDAEALEALPGIGRSTAGAIRAIAMQQPASILDGNVKRVLARFHALAGYAGESAVLKQFWELAEQHTPNTQTAVYTQAIMDLGATVCTRRNAVCERCPLSSQCQALANGLVDELPTPKPKKQKPTRSARFFLLLHQQSGIWLERQPMDGLWGGLWSPPQREREMTTEEFCTSLNVAASDIERTHTAPEFRHTFTHFHLMIEPVYIHLQNLPSIVEDGDQHRWVPIDDTGTNERIGLSAPAVKLMASLQEPFTT